MRHPGSARLRRRHLPTAALGAAAAVVVAVSVAVALVARFVAHPDASTAPGAAAVLAPSGPATIEAGSPWPIHVAGAPVGAALTARVMGPWGVRAVAAEPGATTIVVPAELTRQSGRLLAIVGAGRSQASIDVEVRPGAPVDGIVPLAGPRSMVADRDDHTMVTSFPRDRFGNVVADDTPVTVHVRRPDGGIEVVSGRVESLHAAVRVPSGTVAGRTTVRIAAGGSTGAEVEVLEVAGPPVEVVLVAPVVPLRADGRTLVELATEPLVDRFGNPVADGTVATVEVDAPDGMGTARAVTVGAVVRFVVEAPTSPGRLVVAVEVAGVRSEPLAIEVVPAVADLPVRVERDGDRPVLSIGTVVTDHGGFAPDGTEVLVVADGILEVAELLDGGATVTLPAGTVGPVRVEVLGVATEVIVR